MKLPNVKREEKKPVPKEVIAESRIAEITAVGIAAIEKLAIPVYLPVQIAGEIYGL